MKEQKETKLSPFGHFIVALKGFDLFHKGRSIDKWESFEMGENAESILLGDSRILALKRK